jgi:hypothetical protein
MIKKHIPAPLTEVEIKEKLASTAASVILPKGADLNNIGTVKIEEVEKGNVHASFVKIGSVGYRPDTIGIDSAGKEHTFHGGQWVELNWSVPGIGFGQITFHTRSDGKVEIDAERMGKDFVKAILCDLVDCADKIQ